MNKRNIMNLILLGGIGLPVAGLAGPYALFFVPKGYVSAQQAGMQNRPALSLCLGLLRLQRASSTKQSFVALMTLLWR